MIVAFLAFQQLTPTTKTAVLKLLKLHPDFKTWTKGIPKSATDQQLQTAMMVAATWPDLIKSAPGFKNDGEVPPNDPTAGQNAGYGDKLQHRYWHFIDTPFVTAGASGSPPPSINAEERIILFRQKLADASTGSAAQKLKSYDLVWLLHLMGDIHQPLHCTSRFTPTQSTGDQGGLKVMVVRSTGGASLALHFFWDDEPGTANTDLAAAAAAAQKLPAPDSTAVAVTDAVQWVHDSEQLAETVVYAAPIQASAGPFNLTPAYEAGALTTAQAQLALAGARLAKLLNDNVK